MPKNSLITKHKPDNKLISIVCETCESDNLEEQAWVKVNTRDFVEVINHIEDSIWCCWCETKVNTKEVVALRIKR
jgi:hypothetical protein